MAQHQLDNERALPGGLRTMKPRIFVGSSIESLPVAYALQAQLEHDADVTVWTQGVFKPSSTTLQSILRALDNSDLAVFVLAADDVSTIRDADLKVARDNVVFELGIFVGRLDAANAFFLIPDDVSDFHLPSDLLGHTPLKYKSGRENLEAALGPACNKLRTAIAELGDYSRPNGRIGRVTIITTVDDGSKYAAERVRSAKVVRVVGTARQDVLADVSAASEYLRATEERVVSGQPFSYLRITSSRLSASFRSHLLTLLQAAKGRKGVRVEVALEERMDASVSYMIFDDTDLLLIVDNTVYGSVRDNRLMIWSRDVDLVKAFSDHFDHAWGRLPIKCVSKAEFDRASSVRK